jgi:hypothetical protein
MHQLFRPESCLLNCFSAREFVSICELLAQKVKLVFKAALTNILCSSAISFKMDEGNT